MKLKWIGLTSLMLVLLIACSPEGPAEVLTSQQTPPEIKLLNPKYRLQEVENCMVNEENLPGQAMRINGSAMRINGSEGGLLVGSIKDAASTLDLGSDLSQAFFQQAPGQNSALLIVDDFNGGTYNLGKEVFTLTSLNSAKFSNLKTKRQYSHGALVMHHVESLLENSGFYHRPLAATVDNTNIRVWQASNQTYLVVIAVDTGLSDSRTIRNLTQAQLQQLQTGIETKWGRISIDGPVAINMSFAFMPCAIQDDFIWSNLTSFEAYMQELWVKNAHLNLSYDEFVKLVIDLTNQANDPLLTLLQDPIWGASEHVYVASSGNYGLPYAMYPAQWPEVISVSGSSTDDPINRNQKFFNSGEILEQGAWFSLAPKSQVYYAGTSFSAPTVSVFSALDLASSQRCASGNGISKLAHNGMTDSDYPLRPSPKNDSAVDKLCN
ncbi:MAG: S8/S53 family peptidase [Trueperaceae bacterium]|nr:S8/S53 family peptidase [Trueperaceae bacterium]